MTGKLKVLDLFSGIGGFSLGLERTGGFETVAFCEIEEFPRKVLAKHWPGVPCFEDVRQLKGSDIDGTIDVICGGYPCQPFSTAGKRLGKEDDRHLWPEFARLVEELRPVWVIGENVAGHVSMGLDSVLSDLEALGYAARPFIIPACAVDAKHRRARVWTIAARNDADSNSERPHREEINQFGSREPVDGQERVSGQICEVLAGRGDTSNRQAEIVANATQLQRNGSGEHRKQGERQVPESGECCGSRTLADATSERQQGQGEPIVTSNRAPQSQGQADNAFAISESAKWSVEPAVGRVANGIPDRVDRLKGLGNAVVPEIPFRIGHAILASMQEAA